MKKIISVFQRNYDGDRQVRNEIVPGAEWVIAGEGVATRKWNGTSCLVLAGLLFKRYDAKSVAKAPFGFIPAAEPDPANKHYLGWVPVGDGPEDKWHRAAWKGLQPFHPTDGTYELIGMGVQGNAEGLSDTVLRRHGDVDLPDCPRTFEGLRDYLADGAIEGIVFHHSDGRMAKVKAKDFGIKRRSRPAIPRT